MFEIYICDGFIRVYCIIQVFN